MSDYLRRIEALEARKGACKGGCAKCAIAELGAKASGTSWPGCDGQPLELTDLLLAIGNERATITTD